MRSQLNKLNSGELIQFASFVDLKSDDKIRDLFINESVRRFEYVKPSKDHNFDLYETQRLYQAVCMHDLGKDEKISTCVERLLKNLKFEEFIKNQKDDLSLISMFNLLALNECSNEALWLKFLSYLSTSKVEKEIRTIFKQAEILTYLQSCTDFKQSTINYAKSLLTTKIFANIKSKDQRDRQIDAFRFEVDLQSVFENNKLEYLYRPSLFDGIFRVSFIVSRKPISLSHIQDLSQLKDMLIFDILSENRKDFYCGMDKNKKIYMTFESKFKEMIFNRYGIKYVPILPPYSIKKEEINEYLK